MKFYHKKNAWSGHSVYLFVWCWVFDSLVLSSLLWVKNFPTEIVNLETDSFWGPANRTQMENLWINMVNNVSMKMLKGLPQGLV